MKYFFTIIILFFAFFAFPQSELLPYFENFTTNDYKGNNQNWAITQGQTGDIFVANNNYLLQYNGAIWAKYQTPEKTNIRSLLFDFSQQLLYCGTYKDFGFWKFQNNGFGYQSVIKSYQLFAQKNSEDIWKIHQLGKNTYFQSFAALYCWDGKSIKKFQFPQNITFSYLLNQQLLFSGIDGQIYRLENNQIRLHKRDPLLLQKTIHYIAKIGQEIWYFTLRDGIFVEKNGVIAPLISPINDLVKKNLINTVLVNGDRVYIGTINNGLIIYHYKNKITKILNKNNGLINNTVLSLFLDKEKNIWIGLENGISFIENSSFAIFNDFSGSLGTVYDITPYEQGYLLASNHGLFYYHENQLEKIPNSDGLVWNITPVDNNYIIGTNEGTYIYNGTTYTKLNSVSGGWSFKPLLKNNLYLQSTYNGLYLYQKINQHWSFHKVPGLDKPIKNTSLVYRNIIFATDEQKGVYVVKYNDDFTKFSVKNLSETSKIKKDFNPFMIEVQNTIFFLIESKWYEYNMLTEKLKPSVILQNIKNVTEAYSIDEKHFWVVYKNKTCDIIRYHDSQMIPQKIPEKYYKGRLIQNSVKIKKINEYFVLALNDGFVLWKEKDLQKKIIVPKAELFLDDITFPITEKLPNYLNNATLTITNGYFGQQQNQYYYTLNDGEMQSVHNQKINISSLPSGKNVFTIFQYHQNKLVVVLKINIYKKFPWYLSFWMILVYIILVIAGVFVYYRFNKIKLQQKLKLLNEENRHLHEVELLKQKEETEKAKLLLEKKTLEADYNIKSNELASKALNIVTQNKMIDELKNIVNEIQDSILKNKLEKLIKKNFKQDEWKVFEENINVVHQDFIKRLIVNYPDLSPKDIQLSVYLRMNLSSKEIAPLMAISFRGVEIHRYRLRKKINLPTETNLSKYMINY